MRPVLPEHTGTPRCHHAQHRPLLPTGGHPLALPAPLEAHVAGVTRALKQVPWSRAVGPPAAAVRPVPACAGALRACGPPVALGGRPRPGLAPPAPRARDDNDPRFARALRRGPSAAACRRARAAPALPRFAAGSARRAAPAAASGWGTGARTAGGDARAGWPPPAAVPAR